MNTMRVKGITFKLRILAVAAGLSWFTGCALFDPYPTPAGTPASAADAQHAFVNTCLELSGTTVAPKGTPQQPSEATHLCDAFGYAEGYRLAYVSAARQHAIARNVAGFVTVPLAAVAVFEGLRENGSSSRIARLGVEAVAVYTLTNFLTSTPRQKVYLSGAKAMVCAMFEARPLIVGISYSGDLAHLVGDEGKNLLALQAALDAAGVTDTTATSYAPFLTAQSDARNALAKARATQSELRIAGMTLHNRVDLIAGEVNDLVTDTQPSTDAIAGLFNNFGGLTAGFKQSVAAAKTDSGGGAKPQSGDSGKTELDALTKNTAAINALLTTIGDATTVIDHITQCKPAGADSEFAISPDQASVTVDVGKTFEFTVTNKIATPSRHLEGSNQDAVSLGDITVKESNKFGVSVKGVKATGSSAPTLVIADGTGSTSKSIQILVTGAAVAGANSGGSPGDATPAPAPAAPAAPTGSARPLDAQTEAPKLANAGISVKSLQCFLGVTPDGTVGKTTRLAIAAKRKSPPDNTGPKDQIDGALVQEVAAALNTTAKQCKGL